MGSKLLRIDAGLLVELLSYDGIGRQETFTAQGLPADAEIVDIYADDLCRYGRVTLKVSSSEWPKLLPGAMPELVEINVSTRWFGTPRPEMSPLVGRIAD